MRVFIVGHGAVGTWFGDALGALGCEIVYAARDLAAIEPVEAELAVVAVKAYDTPGAVRSLRAGLRNPENTTILCLQNGVGNEELLAAEFGRDAIVAGASTVPIERTASGVAAAAMGGVGIAPLGAQPHNWLIALLQRTPHEILVAKSAASLKWSKLTLNLVTNAVCAVTDREPAEVVADPALFELELRSLREARDVLKAANVPVIDLPRYPTRALLAAASLPRPIAHGLLARRFAGGRGGKTPSFLLDVRSPRRLTEVAHLNGAVAREGARLGVPTPVHTTLTRILANVAENPAAWTTYRENPAALAAEIASVK